MQRSLCSIVFGALITCAALCTGTAARAQDSRFEDSINAVRAWYEVIDDGSVGAERPDGVVDGKEADSLDHPAMDLAAHDQRIEDAAEVVDNEIAIDHHLAGLRIYLQLADM